MFDIDTIVADLDEDGDTHEIESDGTWTFKLTVGSDDLTVDDVEDPEVFGRYEYGDYRYGSDSRSRPDGFTGAAVKIQSESSQGAYFWYEPPEHLRKFKGSGFTTVEAWEKAKETNLRYVRNLLSWGYEFYTVELTHVRPDGYERKWGDSLCGVESSTGLWGDQLADHQSYVRTIISDLVNEVLHQAGIAEAA